MHLPIKPRLYFSILVKETEVYFEQAADGNKIIKVKKEDRQLYFSGKREPADKARIEIEKWGKIDRHAVVFVTGLGDIAFLKQLVIKIVPSIQLVIYEPSLNVFFFFNGIFCSLILFFIENSFCLFVLYIT